MKLGTLAEEAIVSKADGGPAFPNEPSEHLPGYYGMSLRDWFASQVIKGMTSNLIESDDWDYDLFAEQAYEQAEAMLRRSRK